MSKLQPVRGTKDYFFEEHEKISAIANIAREVGKRFGYSEASTPIFEFSEVFKRTLGDFSDVVNKEMYVFEDRKGQSLTLRPELTASVMRAIISNGMYQHLPMKIFSTGPLFRYERPQRGRMRQFHQINFENVGSDSPFADAETISLAKMIIQEVLGEESANKVSLEINSLGDNESRSLYLEKLVDYYSSHKAELSEDSKLRFEKNPLRILDSKDEGDKKINQDAPKIHQHLSDDSKKYFDNVLQALTDVGIDYKINHMMVRGLDYYNHTTFEFVTDELGAQGTLIAGGRYNGLLKQLGGKDYPGIGFAGGIERLAEMHMLKPKANKMVNIIALDKEYMSNGYKVAHELRACGIACEVDYGSNLSKAIKKSLDKGSAFAIFLGQEEIGQNKYKLKNFSNREEVIADLDEIIKLIKR